VFAKQAAYFSLFAPIVCFFISGFLVPLVYRNQISMITLGVVMAILIFGGLALGIAAVKSARRHAVQGVRGVAITGMCFCGALALLVIIGFPIMLFYAASSRASHSQKGGGLGGLTAEDGRPIASSSPAAGSGHRELTAEDGLDANMQTREVWFQDGGKTISGEINSITFTSRSGQTLPIRLVSHAIAGGQIHTVDFGVFLFKPGANMSMRLFLTDDQIRQIKSKMEGLASGK